MAQKKKASTAKSAASNVTRVRADDSAAAPKAKTVRKTREVKAKSVKAPAVTAIKADTAAQTPKKRRLRGIKASSALKPVKATGGYFKGAWTELKQVRWPTRAATWSMTGAVLLYTAFFVVLVLVLDAIFKYVFELVLG